MVEAGLGVSINPLISRGAIAVGRRVGNCTLGKRFHPIHAVVLLRRDERLSVAAKADIEFLLPDADADAGASCMVSPINKPAKLH
jgi:hypothetical protein